MKGAKLSIKDIHLHRNDLEDNNRIIIIPERIDDMMVIKLDKQCYNNVLLIPGSKVNEIINIRESKFDFLLSNWRALLIALVLLMTFVGFYVKGFDINVKEYGGELIELLNKFKYIIFTFMIVLIVLVVITGIGLVVIAAYEYFN